MFRRIDHIGIIVNNLEEARRWRTDVFGLSLLETRL
jgi:catechol 2,3-dioxygenase-like lactoylglutathione lyase family enzyme